MRDDEPDFDELLDLLPATGAIPGDLLSVETEAHFATCLVCKLSLADRNYAILKDIRSNECVLECAICTGCIEDMHESYSEESRLAMTRFAARGVELLLDSNGQLAEDSENRCELCASRLEGIEEYSVRAFCRGHSLLDRGVVCTKCENEMQDCLSKSTRDERDGFIERHFPGLPGEFSPMPDLIPIFG